MFIPRFLQNSNQWNWPKERLFVLFISLDKPSVIYPVTQHTWNVVFATHLNVLLTDWEDRYVEIFTAVGQMDRTVCTLITEQGTAGSVWWFFVRFVSFVLIVLCAFFEDNHFQLLLSLKSFSALHFLFFGVSPLLLQVDCLVTWQTDGPNSPQEHHDSTNAHI